MATVTAFTSDRSQAIEDETIVSGAIVGDDLILTKNNAATVNAGNVRGPQGIQGVPGEVTTVDMNAAIAAANAAQVIGTLQIEDLAVTVEKIANLAITAVKIADGTITLAKMAANSVDTAQIVDGAVTGVKLANGAITTDKIGADQVTTDKIAAGAVDTTEIAGDAITEAKVADDAIRSEHVNFIFVQASAPAGVTGGIWIDT